MKIGDYCISLVEDEPVRIVFCEGYYLLDLNGNAVTKKYDSIESMNIFEGLQLLAKNEAVYERVKYEY